MRMNKIRLTIVLVLVIITSSTFSQVIVEEIIPVDTSFISYKVIYRETIGDYFQLKRAVFANDTSVVAIEKNYSNGHQNGITRIFYPSGKLRIKAIYGNDKLQGEWTLYGEDGIIITKGVYNYGIKDGYWAYKSLKTYGRYNKGLKHRRWYKKDINNQKLKAFYWKGKFKYGATIFNENYKTHADTIFVVPAINTDSTQTDSNTVINQKNVVDSKYILALKYLAQNYYFRKASKDYFRISKKDRAKFIENYVDLSKDVFKFNVAPLVSSSDVNYFIAQPKLIKPKLDSLLKADGGKINKQLLETEFMPMPSLTPFGTDKNSKIIIYASSIIEQLLVLNIIEVPIEVTDKLDFEEIYKNSTYKKMQVLFLFNNKNEITEVEYQK